MLRTMVASLFLRPVLLSGYGRNRWILHDSHSMHPKGETYMALSRHYHSEEKDLSETNRKN